MPELDLIIHPQWIVPVIPREAILTGHSLGVSNGRIAFLGPREQAPEAVEDIELPGQALMPGLINCHGHAAMSLFRGLADDYPLMTWLQSHIWPAETRFVSEQFVRDGTDLALTELALGGTTTVSDMYFFPDVTAERVDLMGMRAQLGFPVIEVPTAWASTTEEYLAKGLALRDRFRNHDLIEIGFGPHSNYTVEETTLARIATLANELDAPVQIHLHETRGEVQMSLENLGERPVDQLQRIGMLGPRTQCVHMTALAEEDIEAIAAAGAHVVHCPRSNMKLASGICPTQKLLSAGINVALGTDGAASNNRLNLFAEMQTAALLAKVDTGEPTALPAATALEMATINGARALGYDQHTGSLEVGKCADLIAVDLTGPDTQPVHSVLSHLVYATSGNEVSHSWVNGECLVRNGVPTRISLEKLRQRTQYWYDEISRFHETGATPEITQP